MWIEHVGKRPVVDNTAWVAPNAVLSGSIRVGPHVRVLYGAVLTAEGGAEMVVGPECVIMEQAVLRAAGRFPLRLGGRVLVGPHAYLTGCAVGARCFIATGAMVFNGASLGEACTVALGGKVHVDTELLDGTRVPMGWIAFGRPGRIYPPEQAPLVHEALGQLDFMGYVFGAASEGRTRSSVMDDVMRKYTRALGAHGSDKMLNRDE